MLGAILFKEWSNIGQWIVGLLALGVIIVGAKLTSFSDREEGASPYGRKGLIGVLTAVGGGGLYAVLPKSYQYFMAIDGGVDFTYGIMPAQAIGGLLGAFIIYGIKNKSLPIDELTSKYTWRNTLTGLSWSIGNLFMLRASTSSIGLATAFTLSQVNILVGGFGGIFTLKERKSKYK